MAFNLKKVLKALLLSTNQPLSIKDVQAVFTRFHDSAFAAATGKPAAAADADGGRSVATDAGAGDAGPTAAGAEQGSDVVAAVSGAPVDEVAEIPVETSLEKDPELYADVPSLVTATQIREAMAQIAEEVRAADEGLLLIEGNAGYRLMTHPRFGRWLRILRQEPPPVKLSQSAIETLAVVAYRQPVTRSEIETIRGVSAEAGVNKLLERELIYITGRADSPGRPIQYGTTDQFLEFIGIKSLDEMPASDVLSSRQIDEWLKTSSTAHRPNDHDMGLDEEEQLPLDNVVPVVVADEGEASVPAVEEVAVSNDATPAVAPADRPAPDVPVQPETSAQP
ncbi:MAG: SMC-Scp complex subunit ScpB [Opitutaceae bacterium]